MAGSSSTHCFVSFIHPYPILTPTPPTLLLFQSLFTIITYFVFFSLTYFFIPPIAFITTHNSFQSHAYLSSFFLMSFSTHSSSSSVSTKHVNPNHLPHPSLQHLLIPLVLLTPLHDQVLFHLFSAFILTMHYFTTYSFSMVFATRTISYCSTGGN